MLPFLVLRINLAEETPLCHTQRDQIATSGSWLAAGPYQANSFALRRVEQSPTDYLPIQHGGRRNFSVRWTWQEKRLRWPSPRQSPSTSGLGAALT
jgi:hypothetical protein